MNIHEIGPKEPRPGARIRIHDGFWPQYGLAGLTGTIKYYIDDPYVREKWSVRLDTVPHAWGMRSLSISDKDFEVIG